MDPPLSFSCYDDDDDLLLGLHKAKKAWHKLTVAAVKREREGEMGDGLTRRDVEGTSSADGLVLPLDMVGTGIYDV